MNKIITLENLETFAEINDTLKADKAVEAITGNLAKFDENGNPVDSGFSSLQIPILNNKVNTLEEAVGNGGSVDERIAKECAKHYTKEETYNKTELNSLITTPNQKYVSVTAIDQTTTSADVLPAIGETNTIYRVGSWDGTQYDTACYSEYAWKGDAYIHLSTKSQIGEVFDISAYHSNTPYVDLSAALDSNNGGGVPQSLQKGGMSIKFVQSSDNKYVQYRLMADEWSTTESDWQGVDDEPIVGSKNLVESGGARKIVPFATNGYNLFDYLSENIVYGKYIQYNEGTEYVLSSYCYFFIDVVAGKNYCITSGLNSHVAFFDNNNTYISGSLDATFTAPSGAVKMSISIQKDRVADFIAVEGSVMKPYKQGIVFDNTAIKEHSITEKELDGIGAFIEKVEEAPFYNFPVPKLKVNSDSPNILIYQKWIDGYYYAPNGEVQPAAEWSIMPLMHCKSSTRYGKYQCTVAMFDNNLELIGYYAPVVTNFETTANAAFFGVCSANQSLAKLQEGELRGAGSYSAIPIFDKHSVDGLAPVIVDMNGNGDHITILEALINSEEGQTIEVLGGVYNIKNEYMGIYGNSYFDNYQGYATQNPQDAGYYLKKGVKLIGKGSVELVFDYSGSNQNVHEYFSPINTTSDNVVENITITVSENCRYHIHDDFAGDSIYHQGVNVFRNLIFNGKSSKNCTMGCGMGISNIYIIENCYFNQDYANISYHNSTSANAGANRLYISGCYGNGYVRVLPIGTSNVKTQCFVSNCRFEAIRKDEPASGVDNMELIKWNNIETLNS